MTQYFSDILHQPTNTLDVPDLQAIAKDHNVTAILIMCRLSIAIAVQCEKNKEIIERIQRLSEGEQHSLMRAIEQVSTALHGFLPLTLMSTRLWPKLKRRRKAVGRSVYQSMSFSISIKPEADLRI